ncbi:MAG: cellulose binding domain-containing protein [Actinocrinis sp.]
MGSHAAIPAAEGSGRPQRAPRSGRRRRLAAAGAAVTALAVGAGFVMATGANAASPAVGFTETSSWAGGYVAQYTISNTTGAALSTWSVGFTLPSGSTVSSLWNGVQAKSGQTYTVTPADWDAKVPVGGRVSFGFEVDGNGEPSGCTINGASCTGGAAPSGKPSTPASAPAPSVPASPTAVSSKPATSPTASAPKTTAPPASPTPTAPKTTPPASGAFGKFAPYADLSLYPLYALSSNAATEGTKFFNLAFITASGCDPMWGGVTALTDPSISSDISSLRGAGGDVRVSFGGASGTELAQACSSASSLTAAYQKVITAYSLKYIDFDVEGAATADRASIDRRNQAIAALEANNPGLKVSYTLPVLPTGLTTDGVNVLTSAKNKGANLDAVNIMAMDFGGSFTGDMAGLAEQAATATAGQIRTVWTGLSGAQSLAKVAVTPMIGVNDVSSETFTVADASALANWAQSKGLAWLSFWSATRDKQCPGGAAGFAQATCSSVSQSAGAFGQAMSAY